MLKIYNWQAKEDPESTDEIEVVFHVKGVNKQELWVELFMAGKDVIEKNVANVAAYVMDLAVFMYGLFKKTR